MGFEQTVKSLKVTQKEIKKQKRLRLLGWFLIIILVGFFILWLTGKRLKKLLGEQEKLVKHLENDVNSLSTEWKSRYEAHVKEDTYLIYAVREKLKTDFETIFKDTQYLTNQKKILPAPLNMRIRDVERELKDIEKKLNSFNKEFVARRKKEYDWLFKKSPFLLDDDQKTAVIVDEKQNLVVAGAGSGKTETLINRIAYLIERQPDGVRAERILALAFQKAAKEQIKTRLKDTYGVECEVRTFHSLGKEIMRQAKVPNNVKFGDDNSADESNKDDDDSSKASKKMAAYIGQLITESKDNASFQQALINYLQFLGTTELEVEEANAQEKKEFYEKFIKEKKYRALDGTPVKSCGEQAVMNFFLSHKLNGTSIKILYEQSAPWMSYVDASGGMYTPRPDFYFPDHDVYLEHWSIDSKGRVPKWYGSEYKTNMELKKKKFAENKKHLIETTFGEFTQEKFNELLAKRFINKLKEIHHDQKFVLEPMTYDELVEKVWTFHRATIKKLNKNISEFITIAKTYKFEPKDVKERLKENKYTAETRAFADIAVHLYDLYEKNLKRDGVIDFADMINNAEDLLRERDDLFRNVYDHILIDEYQDISTQRFMLIKTLIDKNDRCKLFCVGDDWQSIMGFSGSNLEYFTHFDKYFPHHKRTDLKTNHRSIKSVVDVSRAAIKKNVEEGEQLDKETLVENKAEKKFRLVVVKNGHSDFESSEAAGTTVKNIVEDLLKKGHDHKDIMVLSRITANPAFNDRAVPFLKSHGVKYDTVHSSKGTQAKTVIIANVVEGLYGFPCKLETPAIFDPARGKAPEDKFAEERRLFYVALTRAKENLIIQTRHGHESEFLKDVASWFEREEV